VVYYKDVESRYEVLYKHVLMKFIRTGAALGLQGHDRGRDHVV